MKILIVVMLLWLVVPAFAAWVPLPSMNDVRVDGATALLSCGDSKIRLTSMNDHCLRIRLSPDGAFGRDFSWAVVDPEPQGTIQQVDVDDPFVLLQAGDFRVQLRKDKPGLSILDAGGRTLVKDSSWGGIAWSESPVEVGDPGRSAAMARPVQWRMFQPDETHIYGLGEKTGAFDKAGCAWTMWNTDACAYGSNTDPIYQSIPFFTVMQGEYCFGLFFDNPWRSSFDFGRSERNVLRYVAEGGELNLYVISGPTPKDVVKNYSALTGTIPLPPKWALGYHQSRYSYYPESHARRIAETFRERRIPCDVLYFDIDYMQDFRCFTWDTSRFSDPKKLNADLEQMGFHTICIMDPGIKYDPDNGYPVYDSGTEQNVWVKDAGGEPYVGRVWPGDSVYPDFTNPRVRDWWASLYPPFLEACGVDGIWNDMNEPANFIGPNSTIPLDTRFDNEGDPASHLACHNVYGMQMARSTMEGIQRAYPGKRPFTMTRATYAGGQRYGAAWTGDNISTWEHFRLSISMVMGLGVSGFPFCGPDIGGFVGGATPELFGRWVQVGALMPYARAHVACYLPDQEPWSYGEEVEDVARRAIERRYEMLPYLYTLFEEASRTGVPIVRPVWMECPGWHEWNEGFIFLLGSDVFVAPVTESSPKEIVADLPPGIWFDMDDGKMYMGGQTVKKENTLATFPMFARAGAIIPTQSVIQNTMERPVEPLILNVWPMGLKPGEKHTGQLYEDDGESFGYRDSGYRRTTFSCSREDADRFALRVDAVEGDYPTTGRAPIIRFRGIDRDVQKVVVFTSDDDEGVEISRASQLPKDAPGWVDSGDGNIDVRVVEPGAGTRVEVFCQKDSRVKGKPVSIGLSVHHPIANSKHIRPPVTYRNGAAELVIRHMGWPNVELPRLRIDADTLPILNLRVKNDHAGSLRIRFATEENPDVFGACEVVQALQADGEPHDYRINMVEASKGKWTGTVWRMVISFTDGEKPDEVIELGPIGFDDE